MLKVENLKKCILSRKKISQDKYGHRVKTKIKKKKQNKTKTKTHCKNTCLYINMKPSLIRATVNKHVISVNTDTIPEVTVSLSNTQLHQMGQKIDRDIHSGMILGCE